MGHVLTMRQRSKVVDSLRRVATAICSHPAASDSAKEQVRVRVRDGCPPSTVACWPILVTRGSHLTLPLPLAQGRCMLAFVDAQRASLAPAPAPTPPFGRYVSNMMVMPDVDAAAHGSATLHRDLPARRPRPTQRRVLRSRMGLARTQMALERSVARGPRRADPSDAGGGAEPASGNLARLRRAGSVLSMDRDHMQAQHAGGPLGVGRADVVAPHGVASVGSAIDPGPAGGVSYAQPPARRVLRAHMAFDSGAFGLEEHTDA